jgi:hypothetical protein
LALIVSFDRAGPAIVAAEAIAEAADRNCRVDGPRTTAI